MSLLVWLWRSSRSELAIVGFVLMTLILLPVTAIVVYASSGVELVSKSLVTINPVSRLVELFDPSGKKIAEVQLSTTWPTKGYTTDEFGANDAFRMRLGYGAHTGLDIANERGLIGTPVTPFMEGRVVRVDNINDSACGISVTVAHAYNISSLYCHLSSTSTTVGADVKPGDVIGAMGSTGASTGAHLHFQVMLYGIPVNPRSFMTGKPQGTYSG